MKIFSLGEIGPILDDKTGMMEVVKRVFIRHSGGRVELPIPMQMVFKRDGAAMLNALPMASLAGWFVRALSLGRRLSPSGKRSFSPNLI